MELKRTETNVSTILQSLKDEKEEERSKAALRLGQLIDDVNEVEITGIIDALNEARNIEESSTLKSRIETVLNIYTKAEKETERRKEEEATRRKEEAARKKVEEQRRKVKEAARKKKEVEHREIVEAAWDEDAARRKKEAEELEKLNQQIAEEGDELDTFIYKSRESSKRFPTQTLMVGVFKVMAVLSVIGGLKSGVDMVDQAGIWVGILVFLGGVVMGLFLLLVSEMIKFLMDFHDANYINTKVRIKTLEALQEISKKMKK